MKVLNEETASSFSFSVVEGSAPDQLGLGVIFFESPFSFRFEPLMKERALSIELRNLIEDLVG